MLSQHQTNLRDDRVLPETRWVAALIVPFLVVAFIILYFFPDDNGQFFAWSVTPRMTPLLMGAGYIAGAYFFVRTVLSSRWHTIAIGYLPVTVFTLLLALATFLHWDRFNHGHVSFFAWVALYITTPFILFGLWWRNRQFDPGRPDSDDVILFSPVRTIMGVCGALILATGALLFLLPGQMIQVWPWSLTPLTARVMGGWFALPGVFGIAIAGDRRWSAARLALQSQSIGLVLILLGIVRAWNNFDPSNLSTWLFVAGMGLLLIAIVTLYLFMEHRRSEKRSS